MKEFWFKTAEAACWTDWNSSWEMEFRDIEFLYIELRAQGSTTALGRDSESWSLSLISEGIPGVKDRAPVAIKAELSALANNWRLTGVLRLRGEIAISTSLWVLEEMKLSKFWISSKPTVADEVTCICHCDSSFSNVRYFLCSVSSASLSRSEHLYSDLLSPAFKLSTCNKMWSVFNWHSYEVLSVKPWKFSKRLMTLRYLALNLSLLNSCIDLSALDCQTSRLWEDETPWFFYVPRLCYSGRVINHWDLRKISNQWFGKAMDLSENYETRIQ